MNADASRVRRRLAGSWIALAVLVIGGALTAAATVITSTVHERVEHRLLTTQTRQAAAVIGATVVSLSGPLDSTSRIASATNGDPATFSASMAEYVGAKGLFVAASLWRVHGGTATPVASIGVPPKLPRAALASLVGLAARSSTFVVSRVETQPAPRIAYADADHADPRYVVFAERAIPANRRVAVESNSAFADLRFATYLGPSIRPADLATTDVPLGALPLIGDTATESIPFGNSTITLVAAPDKDLGGALGALLPWICLVGGSLLTIGTALAVARIVSRRRRAESDAATIRGLYVKLDALYDEQRTIAETLQHALLPSDAPELPELDVAYRYVAGAAGVEVGGDWYSIVEIDDRRFGFAVGDVSGRGIGAATVMAKLQFTMRAYLLEGHPPDVVLAMSAEQIDFATDGHFATAVVGVVDRETREVTLANAGHLPPLTVSAAGAAFVSLHPGLPLGVGVDSYDVQRIALPPGATLMAFTDGLVERRHESIDVGLNRLAEAALAPPTSTAAWLDGLLTTLGQEGPEDDIAVLAIRWLDGTRSVTPDPASSRIPEARQRASIDN